MGDNDVFAALGLGAAIAITTAAALYVSQPKESTLEELHQYLQRQLAAWRPANWSSMNFCVQDTRVSYDNPSQSQNTIAVLQAELDFLLSLNPTSVRMDIGYDAFAQGDAAVIGNVSAIVDAVRSAGKPVIFADASREAYRSSPVPWATFQTDWIARVTDLATRFQPDYYLVIKEPGWYIGMISDIQTNPVAQDPQSWLTLLGELQAAVKAASPSTRTGISTTGKSVSPTNSNNAFYNVLMRGAAALSTTDVLAFDCYGSGDIDGTQAFVNANPSTGKQLWLAETWSDVNGGGSGSLQQLVDSEWVAAIYDFCLRIGADMMNPFFTDSMCRLGLSGATNAATIATDYATLMEPSYTTYQQLIGGTIPSVA